MIQIASRDFDIVDIEAALNKVMKANLRSALLEFDGKIGVLHLPSKRLTQGLAEALRTVYVPFASGCKQRGEERDALDVIPMRMADQNVTAQAFTAGRH
jgi:hypothetical protein